MEDSARLVRKAEAALVAASAAEAVVEAIAVAAEAAAATAAEAAATGNNGFLRFFFPQEGPVVSSINHRAYFFWGLSFRFRGIEKIL